MIGISNTCDMIKI